MQKLEWQRPRISDAFKPGTITNTENTLAILEIVASLKALTFFVIKFFPTMLPALEFAYNARLKKIALYDEFVKLADKFIDDDGELRQEKLADFRKICESEFEKGLLYKNVLIGGKIRGLVSDRSIAIGNAPAEYSERLPSEEIVTEDRQ